MNGIELAGTPYDASGLLRPPAAAVGLSAIRAVTENGVQGVTRRYSTTEFRSGWSGVEHFIRILRAVGYVKPSSAEPSYAVLDVLDAQGDIIAEYNVPTARAFAFIKRKLKLVVERPEDEETSAAPSADDPEGPNR